MIKCNNLNCRKTSKSIRIKIIQFQCIQSSSHMHHEILIPFPRKRETICERTSAELNEAENDEKKENVVDFINPFLSSDKSYTPELQALLVPKVDSSLLIDEISQTALESKLEVANLNNGSRYIISVLF